MNDQEIRISQMATRMRDFSVPQASNFPENSLGGQMFEALTALVSEIEQFGADQTLAKSAAQRATVEKREAREAVRRQMKIIRDTAVSLEAEQPGVSKSFRLPPTNGDEALINSARAAVTAATPLKTQFTKRELPITFLDELTAAVTRFETSVSNYNLHRGNSAAATASLKNALSRVLKLRRQLDPIVRNKLRNDPAALAAWQSASHLERAPKKATTPTAPAPPAPQP